MNGPIHRRSERMLYVYNMVYQFRSAIQRARGGDYSTSVDCAAANVLETLWPTEALD